MEWWIGFWVVVGALWVTRLDYRGRKATGRSWLAAGSATRIPFYAVFGGFGFGIVAYVPIFLFDFVRNIFGPVTNPPSLQQLQVLLPGFAGIIAAVLFFTIASGRWKAGMHQLRTASRARGVAALVLAAGSLGIALVSVTAGFVITLTAAKGM